MPVRSGWPAATGAFLQVLSDREEDGLAELGVLSSTGPAADADPLAAARSSYRGLGQAFLGDPAGLELLRRGVADAAAQGQREFAALGYTALVKASRRLGRDADVRRYAEQGLARTRESDLRSHGFTLEAHLYQLLFQAGRWDEAEEGLRHLLRAAPEAGILGRETLPHLGRLLMRRGHPEADALLERAWALACRTDILPVLVPAGIALLERAWLAGDPASERSRVELLLARTDRPGAAALPRRAAALHATLRLAGAEFAGCRTEHLLGLRGDWAGAAAEWAADRRPVRAGAGARRVRTRRADPGGPRPARRPGGRAGGPPRPGPAPGPRRGPDPPRAAAGDARAPGWADRASGRRAGHARRGPDQRRDRRPARASRSAPSTTTSRRSSPSSACPPGATPPACAGQLN